MGCADWHQLLNLILRQSHSAVDGPVDALAKLSVCAVQILMGEGIVFRRMGKAMMIKEGEDVRPVLPLPPIDHPVSPP
jgi:hypothetical protein